MNRTITESEASYKRKRANRQLTQRLAIAGHPVNVKTKSRNVWIRTQIKHIKSVFGDYFWQDIRVSKYKWTILTFGTVCLTDASNVEHHGYLAAGSILMDAKKFIFTEDKFLCDDVIISEHCVDRIIQEIKEPDFSKIGNLCLPVFNWANHWNEKVEEVFARKKNIKICTHRGIFYAHIFSDCMILDTFIFSEKLDGFNLESYKTLTFKDPSDIHILPGT